MRGMGSKPNGRAAGDEGSTGRPSASSRGGLCGRASQPLAIALLVLLVVAIASSGSSGARSRRTFLKGEFERRGVTANYHLDRVGFRRRRSATSSSAIPSGRTLSPRTRIIQTRLKWTAISRCFGRRARRSAAWAPGPRPRELGPDRQAPATADQQAVPASRIRSRYRRQHISLATPFGPLGFALEGNGKLSGGFRPVARRQSALVPGDARPSTFAPTSRSRSSRGARKSTDRSRSTLHLPGQPVLHRLAALRRERNLQRILHKRRRQWTNGHRHPVAGANGLADFVGDISYKGSLDHVAGRVNCPRRNRGSPTIKAERTRLDGGTPRPASGTFDLVGDYAADKAALDPSMIAGVTGPLAAAAKTPIGPVATSIGDALLRTARTSIPPAKLRS